MKIFLAVLLVPLLAIASSAKDKKAFPPHCTQVRKNTDYTSNFHFNYPAVYIVPGQRESFQQLYCTNPPTVSEAVTVVCDWAAPPLVQFTLGDEYVHVLRQDPSGHYAGNAVITTTQNCNHNIQPHAENDINLPKVTQLN